MIHTRNLNFQKKIRIDSALLRPLLNIETSRIAVYFVHYYPYPEKNFKFAIKMLYFYFKTTNFTLTNLAIQPSYI